jgi:hypothetical protein
MSTDFTSIQDHHERPVFEAVLAEQEHYLLGEDLLPDVACVALNRLPPRYIRHAVDMAFYQSEKERADSERAIADAVTYAYEFVQARVAMRAR